MNEVAESLEISRFIESVDSSKTSYFDLLALSQDFQDSQDIPTIKYGNENDDEMQDIADARETYKPMEINKGMYSKNSWIVLLKALHSFISDLKVQNSQTETRGKTIKIFPVYWDFISGMKGYQTIKACRKVTLDEEKADVLNNIKNAIKI